MEDRAQRHRNLQQRSRLLGALLLAGLAGYGLFLKSGSESVDHEAMVNEGLELSADAREAVARFIAAHRDYPLDNGAAGLPAPTGFAGDYVESVTVAEGLVIVRFAGHRTLTLIPDVVETGTTRWACDTREFPEAAECRP